MEAAWDDVFSWNSLMFYLYYSICCYWSALRPTLNRVFFFFPVHWEFKGETRPVIPCFNTQSTHMEFEQTMGKKNIWFTKNMELKFPSSTPSMYLGRLNLRSADRLVYVNNWQTDALQWKHYLAYDHISKSLTSEKVKFANSEWTWLSTTYWRTFTFIYLL